MKSDRLRVSFVMEQHVGHQTYAANLRSAVDAIGEFDSTWVPVCYAGERRAVRMLSASVAAALAGRSEVRSGLRAASRDVAVFNTQVPAALGGRLARRRPYVVITDVTPVQYDAMAAGYQHRADVFAPARAFKHRLNRRVFQRAAACIAWSSWAARSITDDYGVPSERVHVIAPGVDVERWSPGNRLSDGLFRVLFVGGEFGRKGGEDLLAAFATLPVDSEAVIVTRSQLPPTERVRVVSDLGPNDPRLIDLYRAADVFVLPTRAETFGIAAVEASAAGLPVVATAIGGLVDIVADGETGILVEPGDVVALSRALRRLHGDVGYRRKLGEAGRRRALEHFDAERNAVRTINVIRAAAR